MLLSSGMDLVKCFYIMKITNWNANLNGNISTLFSWWHLGVAKQNIFAETITFSSPHFVYVGTTKFVKQIK